MTNQLLTISYITNEGLVVLENTLVLADKFDKQYNDEFAVNGSKIGATCNVRRPPRYIGTFGPPLNVEDTTETFIPVTLNYQFHIDVQFTMADLLLSMDVFKPRVLNPIMVQMANRVDSDCAYWAYQNSPNFVGAFGVAPASYLTYALAGAQLDDESCPTDQRYTVLSARTSALAADGVKGLFNPQSQISGIVKRGWIAGDFCGSDFYKDQNVVSFTTGAGGGAPALTANTGGAFLTTGWADSGFIETNAWTAAAAPRVKVGDFLQIAGVFPANPVNRTQYGSALKTFKVVAPFGYTQNPIGAATPGLAFAAGTLTSGTFNVATGEYSSTAAGALSIRIAECVITGGQFQNAVTTAAFTATSLITVNGGAAAATVSPQNVMLHKQAFALAFADLPLPRGVQEAARASDKEIGMSMRMVSQYTINNDALPTRVDILYGPANLYRQLSCLLPG